MSDIVAFATTMTEPIPSQLGRWPAHVPVLIAGGGPVGLTVAALLARLGVPTLVVEADDSYCTGSRAICISRRSQEILGWIGADRPLVAKGLSWVGGRSYYRDAEVFRFTMPSDPGERFAPMLNIPQYCVEQFVHQAALRAQTPPDVRWNATVASVRPDQFGVDVGIETAGGSRRVRADWVVACDGGRSTVRDHLGLELRGTEYDGKYVIVDIRQQTKRPVERLAWFDPPSNPGSTILMHRQPDDVWRIDYQIRSDEDPAEAVKPDNVLPRVQNHLTMIGETAPWEPLWISIYNAKCLTLDDYRHGRVLFAGDAAHLVPIFGVRGLNSGLDDAGNLAWKLARVIHGRSPVALLDSYSIERRHAALENMAYGAKSTEFMAPPNFAYQLMREATLRLAGTDPTVRPLINPRQSAPIVYRGSPLNQSDTERGWADDLAAAGAPAPEARLSDGRHLTSLFGENFVALQFAARAPAGDGLGLRDRGITPLWIPPQCDEARQRYGLGPSLEEATVLVRPDGYVMGRWRGANPQMLPQAFDQSGVSLR